MKIPPPFFYIFNDKLICGIIGSKKIALPTQCHQYALHLLSKGAIPIYACIYQSMLALFDFKSLLTISIVIGLLFVHIFCLITGKILLNKNKCNTHYVLNSHNNLVKSTATDEQVPGKIKWLAKWVQYYQSWNLILPLLSIDLLCASFYYNCPLNNHVGLG